MKDRKKILWLASWYPNKNERFDGDFIQRHARAAAIYHDVHVIFVTDADLDHGLEEEWHYATGLTEQVIYFKSTAGLLKRTRKHLVWKSLFRGAVKKYLEQNGRPDAVHVHVPWKAGWIALWLKKTYGLPYVVSEHWGIYDRSAQGNFYSWPALAQKMLKQIYLEAGKLVAVSRFLSDGIASVAGRPADLILPNVVDTTLFFPKGEKYSKFSFIHVSNMADIKNAGRILEAFAGLVKTMDVPLQLIMVGNRDEHYLDLASRLDVLNTSVFFKGEMPYTGVAEEMRRCHCFVLFSDSETFSCVTAEALCAGLPVIASRVGALPELVSENNGVLVTPGSVEELTEAMRDVCSHYGRYDHRSIAADAAKNYGYSSVADRFAELYEEDR